MKFKFLTVTLLSLALASTAILAGCKKSETSVEEPAPTEQAAPMEGAAPAEQAAPAEGAAAPAEGAAAPAEGAAAPAEHATEEHGAAH